MRYVVQFADKSHRIVSQREGELIGQALVQKKPIILKGAYISTHFIDIVKPIKSGWFDSGFIETQERAERANAQERAYLEGQEAISLPEA